jgi:hypothetical protein
MTNRGEQMTTVLSEGLKGRKGAALLVALLAGLLVALLTMMAATSHKAQAIPRVGPTAANGFPRWYQDADGTRLDLCLDGPPLCLAAAGDLVAPDGEAFYWDANADMANIGVGGAGRAGLVLAVEAAFGSANADSQITFGRVRVRVDNLRPNTTYKITYPYGVIRSTTDAGGELRAGRDIGCGAASAANPCDFARALNSPVFENFLRWDPRVNPQAPAGFLGNPNRPHEVIGSPTGNNFFLIEGPNVGGRGDDTRRTDLFAVQGKRS